MERDIQRDNENNHRVQYYQEKDGKMNRSFWGRKNKLGTVGLIICCIMAFVLKATYTEWGIIFCFILTGMGFGIQHDKMIGDTPLQTQDKGQKGVSGGADESSKDRYTR